MYCNTTRVVGSGALTALALALGTAHADVGQVYFAEPVASSPLSDRLVIESDGERYVGTADGLGRIDTRVRINLHVGLVGRIRHWKVWLKSAADVSDFDAIPTDLPAKIEESYPFGSRPRSVRRTLDLPTDFSEAGARYCNVLAHELRKQGLSDGQIFAVDRTATVSLTPALSYDMGGPSNIIPWNSDISSAHYGQMLLICQAHEPAHTPLPPGDGDPQRTPPGDDGPQRTPLASLASVSLQLIFDDQPTECPTEILARTLVTASTPGRFTARLRDAFGRTSQVREFTMGATDKQGSQYVKTFDEVFEVGGPSVEEESGSGGSGSEHRPSGLGFDFEELDQDGLVFESDPSGSGDKLEPNHDPNEHVNAIRTQIVDAGLGSVRESDYEEYRITCLDDADPGPVLDIDRPSGGLVLEEGDPLSDDAVTRRLSGG